MKNKKLFERSEFFLFRKSTRFLAPEREAVVFLFCYLLSFSYEKEKSNQSLIFNILAPKPSKSTCVHCSGAIAKVSVLPVSKSFAL